MRNLSQSFTAAQILDINDQIEQLYRPIPGFKRTLQKGGVLCNASVQYLKEEGEFSESITVFVTLNRTSDGRVTVQGQISSCLAERLPGESVYYTWGNGSYKSNHASLDVALAVLAQQKKERTKLSIDERLNLQ